jgi:hypothetical protein
MIIDVRFKNEILYFLIQIRGKTRLLANIKNFTNYYIFLFKNS